MPRAIAVYISYTFVIKHAITYINIDFYCTQITQFEQCESKAV